MLCNIFLLLPENQNLIKMSGRKFHDLIKNIAVGIINLTFIPLKNKLKQQI